MKFAEFKKLSKDSERLLRYHLIGAILNLSESRLSSIGTVSVRDLRTVALPDTPFGFILRSWGLRQGEIVTSLSWTLEGKASVEQKLTGEHIPSAVLLTILDEIERDSNREVWELIRTTIDGSKEPDPDVLFENAGVTVISDRSGNTWDGWTDFEVALADQHVQVEGLDGYTIVERDAVRTVVIRKDGIWSVLPWIYGDQTGLIKA